MRKIIFEIFLSKKYLSKIFFKNIFRKNIFRFFLDRMSFVVEPTALSGDNLPTNCGVDKKYFWKYIFKTMFMFFPLCWEDKCPQQDISVLFCLYSFYPGRTSVPSNCKIYILQCICLLLCTLGGPVSPD